jgi:hypothetical protein
MNSCFLLKTQHCKHISVPITLWTAKQYLLSSVLSTRINVYKYNFDHILGVTENNHQKGFLQVLFFMQYQSEDQRYSMYVFHFQHTIYTVSQCNLLGGNHVLLQGL